MNKDKLIEKAHKFRVKAMDVLGRFFWPIIGAVIVVFLVLAVF